MGRIRSAEQIKQEQIDTIGEEFGSVYNRLYQEILIIHHKWSEFETLYGKGNELIESMNKFAPFCFYIIQNNLFDDVLLSICRITDPVKSAGKSNLTIQLFSENVALQINLTITQIVDEIIIDSFFCRDRRNRIISHLDKNLALNENARPLELANRNKVNALLKKFQELINTVERHYFDSEVWFNFARPEGHALLKWAEYGLKYENLNLKCLETGKLEEKYFEDDENETNI